MINYVLKPNANNTCEIQHKWFHNSTHGEVGPVLGMLWDVIMNGLYCDFNSIALSTSPITKRYLSVVQMVLIVGLTCALTLIHKLLLQERWGPQSGWGEKLRECTDCKLNAYTEQVH
jgi:hypothetical protein